MEKLISIVENATEKIISRIIKKEGEKILNKHKKEIDDMKVLLDKYHLLKKKLVGSKISGTGIGNADIYFNPHIDTYGLKLRDEIQEKVEESKNQAVIDILSAKTFVEARKITINYLKSFK